MKALGFTAFNPTYGNVSIPLVSGLLHKVAQASISDLRLTSDYGVHRRVCLVPMRRDLVSI